MKPQELNLQSEVFNEFMEKLNESIHVVVRNLIDRKLTSGSITAKINVEMNEQKTEDGEIIRMPTIEPVISLKIGASGKVECGKQGGFILKQDAYGGFIIGTDQVTMDELINDGKGA